MFWFGFTPPTFAHMKRILVIISFFAMRSTQAQQVSGYWYGQANVEIAGIHNNYLTELIIQQKGTKVRGFFGYYFKDIYQSFLVKGTYNPATREIIIKNIPIIYFNTNSTVNSVDCITNFYGKLFTSKVKTSVIGYFLRDKKYEYTCPDLRVNYTLYTDQKDEDSIFKDIVATKKFWKPQSDEYVTSTTSITAPSLKGETPDSSKVAKSSPVNAPLTEESHSVNVSTAALPVSTMSSGKALVMTPDEISKINESFKKRKSLVDKELVVASDSIRLSFYDNAEVDGDSISVFLNNKLILAHQELTTKAINVYVKLDSLREVNEVSMFAENLGKYPPNTALMVVNDGDNRYEVFLSSDFKGNATVKFKRKKTP